MEEAPVSQPEEEVCAPAGARLAEALPDAARASARDERLRAAQVPADLAAPQVDARCAPAAQQVWVQVGSAPVSLALEQAGLAPHDSALVVLPGDLAERELQAAHSRRAEPDDSPVDSPARQAERVAPQLAGSPDVP